MNFKDFLICIDACTPAINWASDKSPRQAYESCSSDWLLWLATELNVDQKLIIKATVEIIEPALDYSPEFDFQVWQEFDIFKLWSEGKATLEQFVEAQQSFRKTRRRAIKDYCMLKRTDNPEYEVTYAYKLVLDAIEESLSMPTSVPTLIQLAHKQADNLDLYYSTGVESADIVRKHISFDTFVDAAKARFASIFN